MSSEIHSTTIVCVKKKREVVIAADGQVSLGNTIVKDRARKLRTLYENKIVAGFAGSAADGFSLFERLESKLEQYSQQLARSAIELAKDWRNDKYLRRLEAMMIVADEKNIFLLSGSGDVIEPTDNVIAIGSGGLFALSAARALLSIENDFSAKDIAIKSMHIAADICIYSNHNIITETVSYEQK